jgi:hypothetical protein
MPWARRIGCSWLAAGMLFGCVTPEEAGSMFPEKDSEK